jgi:hypothetical protein
MTMENLDSLPVSTYRRATTGYAHPSYAPALAEFGRPVLLESSGGWLLERPIPDSEALDAMGCYPLFCCPDWSGLAGDLDGLSERLVSVSLVADPLGPQSQVELEGVFDVVRPMKEHYIVDLARPIDSIASKHHRYSAQHARDSVSVSFCDDLSGQIEEWLRLYAVLGRRKRLQGIHTFSPESFRQQLAVPGATLFIADVDGRTVGAHWFFVDGEVAYFHLAAYDDEGYRVGASYALQWAAIEHLQDVVAWLDLGGAPGTSERQEDGLAQFKRGWATHTAQAHLCGRILDQERYEALSRGRETDDYFPAYRKGEFG